MTKVSWKEAWKEAWTALLRPMMAKLPPGHPHESVEYRHRFRSAAVLLSLYRIVGTVAALNSFWTQRQRLADSFALTWILIILYFVYSTVVLLHLLDAPERLRKGFIGHGSRAFLDLKWAPVADMAITVIVNLAFVSTLRRGAAFEQAAEVFAIASISSVTLWTGRYGRRFGALCLIVIALTEVAKAPLNDLPISAIQWGTVASRLVWALAGYIIARGIVSMMIAWADAILSVQVSAAAVEKAMLSHDYYKSGLSRAREILMTDGDQRVDEALFEIQEALMGGQLAAVGNDVSGCVARAILMASRGGTTRMRIKPVDATGMQKVWVRDPAALTSIVCNLCANSVKHSSGTRTTVRWGVKAHDLVMTVLDDGWFNSVIHEGNGLKQSKALARQLGGRLEVSYPKRKIKWTLTAPLAEGDANAEAEVEEST